MAASVLGTSSETDASYWVWFVGGGTHREDGGSGHQGRADRSTRSADCRALAGLGNRDDLDAVPGHQGHRGHLIPLHQHADDLFTAGQLGCRREHLADHHLAGVDGRVELLADEGGRPGGRHGRDVPRGRNRGGAEVGRSEDGASGQALGRHDDGHPFGRGLEQRSGYRRTHEDQSDAEADLPGAALVGPGDQAQTTARLGLRRGHEGGSGGGGGCDHRISVPQLFTDSIWATFSEDVPCGGEAG